MIAGSAAAGCRVPSAAEDAGLAAALAGLLDRLEDGVLLVDAAACVVYANRRGWEIVAARRGLCLRNGVLQGQDARQTRALHDSIAACARRGGAPDGFFLATGGGGEAPVSGHVTALPAALRSGEPGDPAAAVLVADLGRLNPPSARQLRACFGLTAAEAALALEVLAGDGLQACARRLGVSSTTARTHLGHIFEKTGTRRQAELVRVVLGLRTGFRPV